jgi:PAS domain S-box-containing protein
MQDFPNRLVHNAMIRQEMMVTKPLDGREKTILDSINEGVFTVDMEWRITSFNRAAEHITQVSRREALGRQCCDVFRASICENACVLRRTMSSGKPILNATAHIVGRNGERIPIRISTALLKDDKGQTIGGVETFQDLSPIEQLQKELKSRYTFEDIVGHSAAMVKLFEILPQIAESSSTVLIEGPSGTGKELFARAIHSLSPRQKKPFIAVNCGALPDTLLESELFGHKAGAFTDARRDKPGRFALANGGTLFLDEIGDVSPAMQMRLLRVLQERMIEPLGSVEPMKVDVRIVAATNRNLSQLVHEKRFREDLYYRIRVISLNLPSLNQRREDIPLLVNHLVAKFNRLQGKEIEGISDEVMAQLMEYEYPGNVRELENIIEQAFVLCRGRLIELHHLPTELRPSGASSLGRNNPMSLQAMEKLLISEALRRHKGSRNKAAKQLGVNASTLYRKLKVLKIDFQKENYSKRQRASVKKSVRDLGN